MTNMNVKNPVKKICLSKSLKRTFLISFVLLGLFGYISVSKAFTESDIDYYYNFDDTANVCDEYDTTAHNLTVNPNATYFTNGKYNASLLVDNIGDTTGSDDTDACYSPNASWAVVSTSNSYSWNFWANRASAPNNQARVWEMGGQDIPDFQFRFNSDGTFSMELNTDRGWATWTSTSAVSTSGWHNYIITATFGSLSTTFTLYEDNSAVAGSWNSTYNADGNLRNNDDQLTIGSEKSAAWRLGYDGMIDDVAQFNKTLTSDERSSLQSSSIKSILEGDEPSPGDFDEIVFFFTNPYEKPINSNVKIDYRYNQDVITPYDYISIYEMENATSTTGTLIATSTIIDNSYFDKTNGNSWFTLNSTSTGIKYYDIVGELAGYWDAGTGQDVPATSTIPYRMWVDFEDTEFYDWTEQFQATTTTNVLGFDTYSLACTEEEWNSTSSVPITGWNVDRSICRTKKWILDTALAPAYWVSQQVKTTANVLKNTFPFGIILQIKDSWEDSETEELPTGLNWLKITDENGNVYVSLPEKWYDGEEKIILWGPAVFTPDGSERKDLFDGLRELFKYLLWAGFLWYIYGLGNDIYNEIAYNNTIEDRRKRDLQL